MTSDSIEFMRRPNVCEYKVPINLRPKKWHKAVKSHSRYGPRNFDAYSRFIPNEQFMSHTERKDFVLPCGKSLGESWGALRKAWQAFKISLSHEDTESMRKYAAAIRKLQLEMGIKETPFEPELLDEETIQFIKEEVKMLEKAMEEKNRDETGCIIETDHVQIERTCDYDNLLAESKKEILSHDLPPPNQGMFAEFFERDKSCYIKVERDTDSAAEIVEFKHYDDSTVDYISSEPYMAEDQISHNKGRKKRRRVCYLREVPPADREENERKFCNYKAERINRNEERKFCNYKAQP